MTGCFGTHGWCRCLIGKPCRRLFPCRGHFDAEAGAFVCDEGGEGLPPAETSCGAVACNRVERALWLMFGVNLFLTVGQLMCGMAANSLSLLGDGVLMGADGVCYAVSLYAERSKADEKQAKRADWFGALFSAGMLLATSVWVLFDVVDRLMDDETRELPRTKHRSKIAALANREQVDSHMMIAFTFVNLIADAFVVFACWRFGALGALEGDHGHTRGFDADVAGACSANSPGTDAPNDEEASPSADNMNIFGAFAHLAADGARGLAVLAGGLLAVAGLVDAETADTFCSLFVCLFVLAAACSFLRVVLRRSELRAYDAMEDDEGREKRNAEANRHGQDFQPPNAVGGATMGKSLPLDDDEGDGL